MLDHQSQAHSMSRECFHKLLEKALRLNRGPRKSVFRLSQHYRRSIGKTDQLHCQDDSAVAANPSVAQQ